MFLTKILEKNNYATSILNFVYDKDIQNLTYVSIKTFGGNQFVYFVSNGLYETF